MASRQAISYVLQHPRVCFCDTEGVSANKYYANALTGECLMRTCVTWRLRSFSGNLRASRQQSHIKGGWQIAGAQSKLHISYTQRSSHIWRFLRDSIVVTGG
jgi:hypothetical protein